MKQVCWIMLMILIQSQCIYGMVRTSQDTDLPQNQTAKKMKLDWSRSSSKRFSRGCSSPMDTDDADQNENAPYAIQFNDEDMQKIKDALDAMMLEHVEIESTMTQEEQEEFYRLTIIRAIADDSAEEDDPGIPLGEDKDW